MTRHLRPVLTVLTLFALAIVAILALFAAVAGARPRAMPAPDGPGRAYLLECGRCRGRAILVAPGELEATGAPCMACGGATAPVDSPFDPRQPGRPNP